MAITIQEPKTKIDWFLISIVLLLIVFFVAVGYFLFFDNPPLIERVVPAKEQALIDLSQVDFDPRAVIEHATYRSLKVHVPDPSPGAAGRPNPFAPF